MRFYFGTAAVSAIVAIVVSVTLSTPAVARLDPSNKKVAILIFDNIEVIDYSGPLEVLSDAGFDVFTVAATKEPVTTSAGDAVRLVPKYTFDDAPQADLVVIPGGGFEAARDSATVAWIKRETEHAEHTMSVCNGAFTLANTGLLNGLKATTTATNINRFRQTFPDIKVVTDQRVVDNGRLITTAGLSAGIDGALHMVDVMKGEGEGQSVALIMELDWHPSTALARGTMADRFIPNIRSALRAQKVVEPFDLFVKGDNSNWERTQWYLNQQSPAELFAILKTAYEEAYSKDGPWVPKSLRIQSTGPAAAKLWFDDRQGHHWKGVVAVESVDEGASQLAVHFTVNRIG
jgi:putative intracellular protease/amidase